MDHNKNQCGHLPKYSNESGIPEKTDFATSSLGAASENKVHTRDQIALDTLTRYSGSALDDFQKFILLTNFPSYVEEFAHIFNVPIIAGSVLRVAHCKDKDISIIDYRVGAPMAALLIDVLSYIEPQSVIMLGMCGGLHRTLSVGDFLIPVAAIRDEGASNHYMPPQVPSLPAFLIQQFISQVLFARNLLFRTGVIHTTDYRMWEFDEAFRERLRQEKATAIDMEASALFIAGFKRKVPVGALMLVSDVPMQIGGVKTHESAKKVFEQYTALHLSCGIEAISRIREAQQERELNFRRFHF